MKITIHDDRETIVGRSIYRHQLIIAAFCRHALVTIMCGNKTTIWLHDEPKLRPKYRIVRGETGTV
jgi:hypothetical protein